MLNELDIDLEDLEARLYSQVYHISSEDSPTNSQRHCSRQRTETDGIRKNQNVTRYYEMGNTYSQQQKHWFPNRFGNQSNFVPLQNNVHSKPHYAVFQNGPSSSIVGENMSLVPQVLNVVNPFNNIVVVPQAPIGLNPAHHPSADIDSNFGKFLERQNLRDEKRQKKLERFKQLRKAKKKRLKERKLMEKLNFQMASKKSNLKEFEVNYLTHAQNNKIFENSVNNSNVNVVTLPSDIINISDSDGDNCIEIHDNNELVVLSSDESDEMASNVNNNETKFGLETSGNKQNLVQSTVENCTKSLMDSNIEKVLEEIDDDVIFIEPKPAEIIEIDIDPPQALVNLHAKSVADADASKQYPSDKSTETSSTNSADTYLKVPFAKTSKNIQIIGKERRELLSTPDSTASNDFLDNTIDIQQNKFNFGLHGSDFGNTQGFLKPKNHSEMYETESSCSTSDISTPIKTAVFNEIEFETPNKHLFDETNLENFGSYIIPNRNCGQEIIPSILSSDCEQVQMKVNKVRVGEHEDYSNSSSESEYGENNGKYSNKFKQTLPNLSPIHAGGSRLVLKNNSSNKTDKAKNRKQTDEEVSMALIKTNRKSDQNENKSEDDKGGNKKTKNKKQIICTDAHNKVQPDNVDTDERISTKRKSDQNEVRSDEESNPKKKNKKCTRQHETGSADLESDAKDVNQVNTITVDNTENVMLVEDHDQNEQFKSSSTRISDVTLSEENLQLSEFIILDETGEDNIDGSSSSASTCSSNFVNFETDMMLANCEISPSKHPAKSDEPSKQHARFADYWTMDMDKFHNRSWGLQNFSVEETQKTMSDDPNLWKIIDRDRVFVRLGNPRGQRCRRCREIGHISAQCRNKPATPTCSLCGIKGHHEPRCPHAMCTSCGQLGGYGTYCSTCASWRNFQCKICKMFGHLSNTCPDLWRRYHLTTKAGPIVVPDSLQIVPYKDRWCSGCAKFGHFEHSCRYYTSVYCSTTPEIQQYVDVYDFTKTQATITLTESIKRNTLGGKKSTRENSDVDITDDSKGAVSNNNPTAPSSSKCCALSYSANEPVIVSHNKCHDLSKSTNNEASAAPSSKSFGLADSTNKRIVGSSSSLGYASVEIQQNTSKAGTVDISASTTSKIATALSSPLPIDIKFPPFYMIPTYFQQQLSYLKFGSVQRTTEDSTKDTCVRKESHESVEQHSMKIDLCENKLAYLHSAKGKEFIHQIKIKNNVNIVINKTSENEKEVGTITVCGYQKELGSVIDKLRAHLQKLPKPNIPRNSALLYSFLRRNMKSLHNTEGNCRVIFNSIMVKKKELITTAGIAVKNKCKKSIKSMFITLNMLLFGRCKLHEGQKHMKRLEFWVTELHNKQQYYVPLEIIFDIFESYSYIYKMRRSDKIYEKLVQSLNYYIKPESVAVIDLSTKQYSFFHNKCRRIIKNCKKYHLDDKLKEVRGIQNDVIQSNYSRATYEDFVKYVGYFTKYFCNLRTQNIT